VRGRNVTGVQTCALPISFACTSPELGGLLRGEVPAPGVVGHGIGLYLPPDPTGGSHNAVEARVTRYSQPRYMWGQQCVAEERQYVEQRMRQHERPQAAGPHPPEGEHQTHREVAQPSAEALVEVVRAPQEGGAGEREGGRDA